MSNIRPLGWPVVVLAGAFCLTVIYADGGQITPVRAGDRVLAPLSEDNLTIFPVVTNLAQDTHGFLTLDEGLRTGQVVITEEGSGGLVRPRYRGQIPNGGAAVNSLVLYNNSDRALILLGGEIVTGGKQDRIVGKDRIVPAHSDPVDLDVFCVEPHRWTGASARFGNFQFSIAQPSIRFQATARGDQQAVWDEVAKSQRSAAVAAPAPDARALAQTSSYAGTMQNDFVQGKVESVAAPIERSYDRLIGELRAQKAVGVVVAINNELVWADVFASPSLFEKYWPKLIRSYAAEALAEQWHGAIARAMPSPKDAQMFLDDFNARHETVESEPRIYRNTEFVGDGFDAFVLTSLLPGMEFDVHAVKMRRRSGPVPLIMR